MSELLSLLPADMTEFHFLRPLWLLMLPLALAFYWALLERHSAERIWRGVIAPHLLSHLTLNRARGWRLEPRLTMALALAFAGIALAGPTWQREPPPFVEDRAPLIIALDLSPSMNSVDVQPTRLIRAKQKIRDLLALRRGARTALIVYRGSAHMVLPLTDDGKILASYVDLLETNLLPQDGKRTDEALHFADAMLAKDPVPGSIVLLTDSVEGSAAARVQVADSVRDANSTSALNTRRLVWGIGSETSPSNGKASSFKREGLIDFATSINASFVPLSLDNDDVLTVQRQIDNHLEQARASTSTIRWRDAGYWLLWPIVLLAGLSFRRGWTVRW
ncbi:MAG: VWA domain-containing protein [Rhodocyclaceae bacterium]|nr:VWA domain-containing protein [Rhodocyclaceae bacterium]